MPTASQQLDAYITKSAEFARPILNRLRRLFHKACPDIEETMKWSFPHFERNGIVGSMAAFKAHVSFGLWKATLIKGHDQHFSGVGNTSMAGSKCRVPMNYPTMACCWIAFAR